MPHFLINSKNIFEDIILTEEPDTVVHLACALRAKAGEIVKFIDENKVEYRAQILDVSKKAVRARILDKRRSVRELGFNIFAAQSVLKQEAQNLLISNAAQLGLKGVYPFISRFSTVKESFAKGKVEKWQKISFEAFKQCERADIMPVYEVLPIKNVLEKFEKKNVVIFAERLENTNLFECTTDMDLTGDILAVIGPEGGFSDDEFEYFKNEGYKMATLGNMIFKAPNALVSGVSNLIFSLEMRRGGFLDKGAQ